uniref:Uncharacterized protein n=1 Tax=Scophthalmus maximus TaxID=52904 RepID=A0A8D3BII3_SCOMX
MVQTHLIQERALSLFYACAHLSRGKKRPQRKQQSPDCIFKNLLLLETSHFFHCILPQRRMFLWDNKGAICETLLQPQSGQKLVKIRWVNTTM